MYITTEIRRLFNNRKLYIYPETNEEWIKKEKCNLNSEICYFDPYCVDDDGKKYIFLSNRNTKAIDRFDITDDFKLINKVEVFSHGGNGEWDEIVNRACIVKKDGKWNMWYTGRNKKNCSIGYAYSDDGVKYIKNSKPVLLCDSKYEGESIMNPCVLWNKDKNIFQMWYSAGETYEPDVICYAESLDGIKWNKYIKNPVLRKGTDAYDICKVGGCDVHFVNNEYIMYYIGYQNIDSARICEAHSMDGIHWKRKLNNPLISPSRNKWDRHSIYKPAVIRINNNLVMFYNGRYRNTETIGYALKKRNI